MSIRARVTLYGLAIVLVVLTCFSASIWGLVVVGLPGGQDKRLAARAAEAVRAVDAATADRFVASRPLAPVQPATDDDVFVVVLDGTGAVLSTTGGIHPVIPAALLTRATRDGTAAGTVGIDGVPVRVCVKPWHRTDLGRDGFVVAAQPLRQQHSDLAGVTAVLIVAALVTMAAAAVAISLVVRRALRPLRELTATADEVGRSPEGSRRLPPAPRSLSKRRQASARPPRQDDVGRLTASFNGMLDRLEEANRRTVEAHQRTAAALAAQQRFAADASHELRTPLTTIRNNAGFLLAHPEAAEADRAAALADLEAESVRMSRLVDDLLTLARGDGGAPLSPSSVDIGALVHEVCRTAGAQHPDRRLHCSGPPCVLRVDADALTRLLWILLDNAVRHTGTDGQIWIAVSPTGPGTAMLQVSDDGEGIPPHELSRIFERFHQAEPARRHGGAGLGLSIAAWIAYAHRGSISAANNDRGGAIITVRLSSIS
jgi:signal transduction histidine kinase